MAKRGAAEALTVYQPMGEGAAQFPKEIIPPWSAQLPSSECDERCEDFGKSVKVSEVEGFRARARIKVRQRSRARVMGVNARGDSCGRVGELAERVSSCRRVWRKYRNWIQIPCRANRIDMRLQAQLTRCQLDVHMQE